MSYLLSALLLLFLAGPMHAATFTLRYADQNPGSGTAAQRATIPWHKNIEAATDNEVQIEAYFGLEAYFGETLLKARDIWDAVRDEVADIAWMSIAYWPGKAPMSDAFGLPGLKYKTAADLSGAMWKAYEKYPEMQHEFACGGIRPLIFFCTEPYSLFTTKKQVKTMEDLKDMRIRTLGGAPASQMKALGGIPLSISMPENYISLQRGVIDGLGAPAEAMVNWRFFEVVNYCTEAPLSAAYHMMGIGEKQWQRIPAEIQERIMTVCGYEGSRWYAANYFTYFIDNLPEVLAKNNQTIDYYTLPADEARRWIDASSVAFDEYYSYADSKGVGEPARQLVRDLMEGIL